MQDLFGQFLLIGLPEMLCERIGWIECEPVGKTARGTHFCIMLAIKPHQGLIEARPTAMAFPPQ